MKLQLVSILGMLALVKANSLERRAIACNHNNCYRAIVNAPNLAADCASYWPGVVTVTVTETQTSLFTNTASQTATETFTDSKTESETSTDSQTATETSTESQTATETSTESQTATETSTDSQTATETSTDSQTESHTSTESQTESQTSTDPLTESYTSTGTLSATQTFTSDITIVSTTAGTTETITIPLASSSGTVLAKRQQEYTTFTDDPTRYAPLYAANCLNWARYSTACYCLTASNSVTLTPGTVTVTITATTSTTESTSATVATITTTISPIVATVTTTISPVVTTITSTISPVVTTVTTTISSTVTTLTSTISPVVTTITSTISPVVTTITTTISTIVTTVTTTISPTVTTVTTEDTTVVTDASTTISNPVTTVTTTTAAATSTWIAVYLAGREDDATKANQYLKLSPELANNPGVSRIWWSTTQANATKFYLNPNTKQVKADTEAGVARFLCTQAPAGTLFRFWHIMTDELCQSSASFKLKFNLGVGNIITLDSIRFPRIGYSTNATQNEDLIIAADVEANTWAQYQVKEVFLKAINGLEAAIEGVEEPEEEPLGS
ncbi:hypothetical protein TWF481_005245 [Arthrobotrys musiformis]|uniref:CBM-cenC domain-containing protein n=1 Tax=Arthrobotrys musiformis TaxID=47236 RepID=A0AAV9WFB4_9PEZI